MSRASHAALLRGAVPLLLLLAAWQGASLAGLADPRLLPSLGSVARSASRLLGEGELLGNLAVSLRRDLAGFALGAAAGTGFGLLLGLSRVARQALGPSFNALKGIAVFAWIPLIAIWFGFGEASKIAFVALAAFTPVAVNAEQGARATPLALLEVGRALGFGRVQRLWRIHLPSALPSLLTGLQLGLLSSWLATIGAEYFLAKGAGLGGVLIEGRDRFDMPQVLLGVLVLGGTGFLLNRLAVLAEARLLRWRRA